MNEFYPTSGGLRIRLDSPHPSDYSKPFQGKRFFFKIHRKLNLCANLRESIAHSDKNPASTHVKLTQLRSLFQTGKTHVNFSVHGRPFRPITPARFLRAEGANHRLKQFLPIK